MNNTTDLGRVVPLFKGEYNSGTAYEFNDLVLYTDGGMYWHVGESPTTGVSPTDTSVWKKAVDPGDIPVLANQAQEAAKSAKSDASAAASSRTAAEQAQANAESAKDNAVAASTAAQSAQQKALEYKNAAESAQSAAKSAQAEAENARSEAQSAQKAAKSAQSSAETAQSQASSSAASAQSSATAASDAKQKAADAQTASESARDASVTAQKAAEASSSAAKQSENSAKESADKSQENADKVEAAFFAVSPTLMKLKFLTENDGKIYSTKIYNFKSNPTSSGLKMNSNANLVCKPSTDTDEAQDDYENIPLFRWFRCNYVREDDGFAKLTAFAGDVNFKTTGSVDVGTCFKTFYWKVEEVEDGKIYSISDTQHEGFIPWAEAVRADGTVMPYFIYSAYWSGIASDGLLRSQPDLPLAVDQSHNNMITNYQKKGAGYWGGGIGRFAYGFLMLVIKYATKNTQAIFQGCTNYSWQYPAAVERAEKDTYFPLTKAQAANVIVGSRVSIGVQGVASGAASNDRGYAAMRSKGQGVKVLRIEDMEDGNCAVYVDAAPFDTLPVTTSGVVCKAYISSWPWASGSTDCVIGHHDGSRTSNTSAKYPCRIQGLEFFPGAYTIYSDAILDIQSDYSKNVLMAMRGTKHSSSDATIRATYKKVGTVNSEGSSADFWTGDFEITPECALIPNTRGAGSANGNADYLYFGGGSTSGTREWLAAGALRNGANAGFCCSYFRGGLGDAGWHCAACD